MKKIFLLTIIVILAIQSCTFKQDVTFNKNWSGEMACVIDMKEMAVFMDEGENKFNLLEEEDSKKKLKQLKETKGITKVKVKELETGVYAFSYQFKNITALNKSANVLFADDQEPVAKEFTYFTLKDQQNLFFTMPFGGEFAPVLEEDGEENSDNAMSESFSYELTFKFPKKVKNLVAQNGATLSDDKTKITLKTDVMSMTSKDFTPEMQITFEK